MKIKKQDLTFTYSASGYMLFFKGNPIGGAAMSGKFKNGQHRRANALLFHENAISEMKNLLSGHGQSRFLEAIKALARD